MLRIDGIVYRRFSSLDPLGVKSLHPSHATLNVENCRRILPSSLHARYTVSTMLTVKQTAQQLTCPPGAVQGTSECFSQYASSALREVQTHMAAAVKETSSSSSSGGGGGRITRSTYDGVAPSVLGFAQLLTQYSSYNLAQRRQLLDALQQQLLPRVSSSSCRHLCRCFAALASVGGGAW
jgi:hypothetical protein